MSKRAQVSLIFTDEILYDNCIQQLKENRELSNVIVRCLSAYYYNDEVRIAVDGLSEEDLKGRDTAKEHLEAIKNIQTNLTMLSFDIDEASSVLEGGVADINDIMNGNIDGANSYQKYTEEAEDIGAIPMLPKIDIDRFAADKRKEQLEAVQHKAEVTQQPVMPVQQQQVSTLQGDSGYMELRSEMSAVMSAISNLYSLIGQDNPFVNNGGANNTNVKENMKNNEVKPVPEVTVSQNVPVNDFDNDDLAARNSQIDLKTGAGVPLMKQQNLVNTKNSNDFDNNPKINTVQLQTDIVQSQHIQTNINQSTIKEPEAKETDNIINLSELGISSQNSLSADPENALEDIKNLFNSMNVG